MSPSFLAAQAANGLAVKRAAFIGGKFMDAGSNSSAQSNLHFSVEEGKASPSRHGGREFTGDVGIKTFSAANIVESSLMIGDKWWDAAAAGNSSLTRDVIRYDVKRISAHPNYGNVVNFTKIANKQIDVKVGSAKIVRYLLYMGHYSGTANDGTLAGIENSHVRVSIGSIEPNSAYTYVPDGAGAIIGAVNNKKSNIAADLPGFSTTIPKFLTINGIQDSNSYTFRFHGKTVLNQSTSTDIPFNLSLSTSTATIDGEFVSNVNADLVQVMSGTVKLKGRFVQQAAGKSVISVAPGAKVICDCELVTTDGVTPTVTGGGTFISLNAKMNVAPNQTVSQIGSISVSSGYNY
jgi:hypothetical protein